MPGERENSKTSILKERERQTDRDRDRESETEKTERERGRERRHFPNRKRRILSETKAQAETARSLVTGPSIRPNLQLGAKASD